MAFFSRPNLDNLQFKQEIDDILNLEGKTIIVNPSGLTFLDDNNIEIPVIIDDVDDGKVLMFKNGALRLEYGDGSSGGTKYYGSSPTTISVGGMDAGTEIYGKTIDNILEQILAPALNPVLTDPTFSINLYYVNGGTLVPIANRILEVGSPVSGGTYNDNEFKIKTVFNRGTIEPEYDTSGFRVGKNNRYVNRTFIGTSKTDTTNIMNGLDGVHEVEQPLSYFAGNDAFKIGLGNNWISSTVFYDAGEQPKNSSGDDYSTPKPAGSISKELSVEGIYPYFYGKSKTETKPTTNDIQLSASTSNKEVKKSNSSITINFNSEDDEYIWFAIPATNPNKLSWKISELNKGDIGTEEDLFDTGMSVLKTTQFWSINYKIYISNYPTEVKEPMTIS